MTTRYYVLVETTDGATRTYDARDYRHAQRIAEREADSVLNAQVGIWDEKAQCIIYTVDTI